MFIEIIIAIATIWFIIWITEKKPEVKLAMIDDLEQYCGKLHARILKLEKMN
jgi:hypothetical protein